MIAGGRGQHGKRWCAMDWGTLSRRERDTAYNNPEAVADSAALSEARTAASAAIRAAHPGALDLAYGPRERNRWDLFPAPDPAAPCLVLIHGGYWQRNSREGFSVLVEGVRAHGWSAALPGYTLAPDSSLSGIVAEIFAALDWLAAEGPARGVAGPLVVSGWSAGGHLTAMALGHRAVRAGLAISGIFELGPLRDTYLNEKLRLTDAEVASLSPLRLAPVAKPLAIAYGTAELPALAGNSRAFHAHRAAAHAPGPLLPLPRANHFTILDELRHPQGQLVSLARRLID
jgi:acetyl esterase/lipase